MSFKKKYLEYEAKAKEYVDKILQSDATKKLIIAGPGTGKSYLFKLICKDNIEKGKSNNLALSFINELVIDLTKDLYQLAEVRTLHSFALSQLPRDNKFYLFLGDIIEEDYRLINDEDIDYSDLLCNLIDNKDKLEFYSKRRKYYNHFSPNCSVYTLVIYYEQNKNKIPTYSQILIDEYQDFNKLEARLIGLLSEKNSIVIVGDDDQSLYAFKHANPDDIREKHNTSEFVSFELPFCLRCTEVMIRSFDNVIKQAKNHGYLTKRLNKQFKYFPTMVKDNLSGDNPKILVKKKIPQSAVAYNIEQEIKELFDPNDKELSVLIICSLKQQIKKLGNMLTEKGFRNIHYSGKSESEGLIEGFVLLLRDKESNLGWRIVSKYIMKKKNGNDFADIVKLSQDQKEQKQFKELVPKEYIRYIKSIISILRKINNNKEVTKEEAEKIFDCLDYDSYSIALQKIKAGLTDIGFKKVAHGDIPIKITTILGSKGLTSSYTFLVNFDDKYLLEKNGKVISDESICKFLVALTRANRRVYVYSNDDKLPTYVEWMGGANYEEI